MGCLLSWGHIGLKLLTLASILLVFVGKPRELTVLALRLHGDQHVSRNVGQAHSRVLALVRGPTLHIAQGRRWTLASSSSHTNKHKNTRTHADIPLHPSTTWP
jgi:hypothetical protein